MHANIQQRAKSILKAISRFMIRFVAFYVIHLPPVLIMLVGIFYQLRLITQMDQDTSVVTNVGFGIAASLSALCFSGARAIRDSEKVSDSFAYAGERFLHAGILMLTASVFKYALLSASIIDGGWNDVVTHGFAQDPLKSGILIVATSLIFVLFSQAILYAHRGFVVLNRLLWNRVNRLPGWDDMW